MNDRLSERIICPFFQGILRSKRLTGIECEELEPRLGFRVSHFLRLRNGQDLADYVDIFCADMWETCPYCRALQDIRYGGKL